MAPRCVTSFPKIPTGALSALGGGEDWVMWGQRRAQAWSGTTPHPPNATRWAPPSQRDAHRDARRGKRRATCSARGYRRSTIIFLISAMALAGLRLLGQVRVQFMMVWQR